MIFMSCIGMIFGESIHLGLLRVSVALCLPIP